MLHRTIVIGPVAHTMGLNEAIKEALKAQNRSLQSFATDLGISRRQLSTWRDQDVITMPVAVRLVEAAGLEVAQVFEHLDPLGLVAADLRRRLSGLDPRM